MTTETITTYHQLDVHQAADRIRTAEQQYGHDFFEYVDTLPFAQQMLLEAFVRDNFSVTDRDGTQFLFDRKVVGGYYRQPDYEAFADYLARMDVATIATIEGMSMGGRVITLHNEGAAGWSIWLTRKHARYQISTVYELPWRDATYAPDNAIRALVAATEADYQEIARAAHEENQLDTFACGLHIAAKALAPLNAAVAEWPTIEGFRQPSVIVVIPDHYQLPAFNRMDATVTVNSDGSIHSVEIAMNGWVESFMTRDGDFTTEMFTPIASKLIAADRVLAISEARRREAAMAAIIAAE